MENAIIGVFLSWPTSRKRQDYVYTKGECGNTWQQQSFIFEAKRMQTKHNVQWNLSITTT